MTNPNHHPLPEKNHDVSGSLSNTSASSTSANLSDKDLLEAERLALATKKRRTLINWLRVTALLFALFFLLSQCGMSKPKAKAAIIESCIKNIPFSAQWQTQLQHHQRANSPQIVQQYCICMWDEPLQQLTTKQIQSFAKISTDEQLALLGGTIAFEQRDKQCMAQL